MSARRSWLPALAAGLFLLAANRESPGRSIPPAIPLITYHSSLITLQPPADPLPNGAKLRLGTTRLRDISGWSGAAITPDGNHLVAIRPGGLIRVEIATGLAAGKSVPPPQGVFGGQMNISADGKWLVNISYNSAVVWDPAGGKIAAKVERLLPFGDGGAALSADGKVLAVGGTRDDKAKDKPVTAVVWDVEKNARRTEVAALQNQTVAVAVSGDGSRLATWGSHSEPIPPGGKPDPAKDYNRVIQLWDGVNGKELGRVRVDGYGTPTVAFAADGKIAAVANSTGVVQLIDAQSGAVVRQLFGRSGVGMRVAFGPDGKHVAAAGGDGTVQMWQVADGKLTATVESPLGSGYGFLREIRFAGPDRVVVWAVVGNTAVVWEAPSGKLLSPAGGHTGAVSGVTFATGGKEVLTGGENGQVLRWDAASGKEIGPVALRVSGGGNLGQVQFAYDGFGPGAATVVVNQGRRGLYDLATGIHRVSAPDSFDTRNLFAQDGRTLASMPFSFGMDGPKTARLAVWDTTTGTRWVDAEVASGELVAVAVTPDRSKVVTAVNNRGGKDNKTELLVTGWDAAGGKKLGELTEKGGYGTVYVTPAPDNTTVLVGTTDDRLVQVDMTTGKAVREIDTGRQRVTAGVVFSPDGKAFAVGVGSGGFGPAPGLVRVHDAATGKFQRSFSGHTAAVTCLAFSPDGKTLASGSFDTTVLLWDVGDAGK